MGAHLSPYAMKPVVDCTSEEGYGPGFRYGASTMQGWRKSQEDTFKCDVQNYGNDYQYFAVFDGHGGAEVAKYLEGRLHSDIRSILDTEKDPELALQLGFLICDTSIKDPEGLKILNTMVEKGNYLNHPSANLEKTRELFFKTMTRAGWPDGPLVRNKDVHDEPGCSSDNVGFKKKYLDDEEDESDEDSDYLMENNKTDKNKDTLSENNLVAKQNDLDKKDVEKEVAKQKNDVEKEVAKQENDVEKEVAKQENDVEKEVVKKENDFEKEVVKKENDVEKEIVNEKGGKENDVDKDTNTDSVNNKNDAVKAKTNDDSLEETMSIDEPVAGSSSNMNNSNQNHANEEVCPMDTLHYLLNDDLAPESSDPEDEDFDIEDEPSCSESEEEDTFEDFENLEPGVHSGSTGTVLLIGPKHYYCANVGDSRMVMCKNGKAIDMSIDHKPEDPEELKRINATGAKVSDGRINRSLNLSRAFGDFYYKDPALEPFEQCVTVEPTVKTFPVEEDDEFIVMASDGIWNSMSSQEVVDYVRFRLKETDNLTGIGEELFKLIVAPNTHGDGTGCDNMTFVLIQLNPKELLRNNDLGMQASTSEASNSKQSSS